MAATLKYEPLTDADYNRFMSFVQIDSDTDCWVWKGAKSGRGYGVFRLSKPRRQVYAHRQSYVTHFGCIKDEEIVHHTCENIQCVNPAHLKIATQSWHMLQHKNGDKGNVCINGHPRNVYGRLGLNGKVACRECQRINMQERRARQREST